MHKKLNFTLDKTRSLNLFSFARKVLGYTLLEENPHLQWCNELDQRHSRSIWLEPRYTYKSSVFTKSYPIWRLLENPNLRILIVNATAENAEAFLSEIVGHLLRNKRFLELHEALYHTYPLDLRAAKTKSFVLNTRTRNFSEPSIGTVGALGNLVSAHYDLIIVDDLCNIDDRESPSIREKKKRWFKDLVSVLSPDGELVIVGTHWHFDDVYSYIINELNPQLPPESKYLIHRDSCYLEDGVTARFPHILSAKKLANIKIEKGMLLFACQYLNRPIPTEHQIFKLEAMSKIPKSEIKLEQAEAYGFCDPSLGVSDYAAIVTLLKLKNNNSWVVFHVDLARSPHSKTINKIIELHSFFNYKAFGIEANSLGKAKSDPDPCNFEFVLRERQANAKVTVPYKLIWHTAPKLARIQGIESYFSNGQLKFLSSWNREYPELIEQLIHFPLAAHDDGPDALAGAVSLLLTESKAQSQVLIPRVH
jgi:predicted phage terminase large subunit-like protein